MAKGFIQKPITEHYVSGVWNNHGAQPEFFAVHDFLNPGVSGARKLSKAELIKLISTEGFSVYTWIWDYSAQLFKRGRKIQVIGEQLNTIPADTKHKDLRHLIHLNWSAGN